MGRKATPTNPTSSSELRLRHGKTVSPGCFRPTALWKTGCFEEEEEEEEEEEDILKPIEL